jgi:N-acetyl-gamma-glutamyl-phosphate reductase
VIEPFVPEQVAGVDLLFASLPTGKSAEPLARVPRGTKIVDVGGDHRFVPGWTYGLTELPGQRERIRGAARLANPGCYPAAALLALAPLLREGLVEPEGIVIDAKSGVTGTGRGGSSDYGYCETNEDVFAYGLEAHPHVPEIEQALAEIAGRPARVAFTPHLVPMTRGILATCYARPAAPVTTESLLAALAGAYEGEPFVAVRSAAPSTKATLGTNAAHLTARFDPRTGYVVVLCAIDNLTKGASGGALQAANVALGLSETAGLTTVGLLP